MQNAVAINLLNTVRSILKISHNSELIRICEHFITCEADDIPSHFVMAIGIGHSHWHTYSPTHRGGLSVEIVAVTYDVSSTLHLEHPTSGMTLDTRKVTYY